MASDVDAGMRMLGVAEVELTEMACSRTWREEADGRGFVLVVDEGRCLGGERFMQLGTRRSSAGTS